MAQRPSLTNESFLRHLFSPKKHLLPTGLRRTKLVGTKGRDKARLKSFNRMSALNQAVLTKSGQREAYLRGEVSFLSVKQNLRRAAVELGFVKRARVRQTPAQKKIISDLNQLAGRYVTEIRSAGKEADIARVMFNFQFLNPQQQYDASRMDYSAIKRASIDPDNMVELQDGTMWNPYWYH